jgi:hypothetical protein
MDRECTVVGPPTAAAVRASTPAFDWWVTTTE